jgi:pyruvate kinase
MDLGGPRCRTGQVVAARDDVRVSAGDLVLLVGGSPAPAAGFKAVVECSVPAAVAQLAPGDDVFVDEGRIGATVVERTPGGVTLEIRSAPPKGGRLRTGKGLNFPRTELRLPPLTASDLEALDVAVADADLVGYSFVQRPSDIDLLQHELRERLADPERVGLVAKIETELAVRSLPELIVQGAGSQPLAVMIARGDLAVEIGYRRLAEVQEELLWLCEAAHVPVIWATQVLDGFVHKGTHSRAEMTDVAMAERAECVMLNKGPYLLNAVGVLDDVLIRMEAHQSKKTSRLRALSVW